MGILTTRRAGMSREATRVLARMEALDAARIRKFRSDYLMLMRNAGRIQDYGTAVAWKSYVAKWVGDFEDYIFKGLIDTLKGLNGRREISDGDFSYWDVLIRRRLWDFVTEFRVPVDSANAYYSEESMFSRFQSELPRWKSRVDKRARAAWKVLDDFVQWYEGQKEKALEVDVPISEKIEMEGFAVTVKGTDSVRDVSRYIELFREGLKRYKSRASKVYPWLLRNQLPIVLDFKGDIGTGGEYRGRYIWVNGYASGSPEGVVHVLAHEMAHHRYDHLGRGEQDFWDRMMSGDLGKVDLKEVASKYADDVWLFDNEKIKNDDPILYYQLMGLKHDRGVPNRLETADTVGDIRKYLEEGGAPVVSVHRHPVSGYASKNSKEAFCEALGFLVAYGPNSVPDIVLGWLKTMLPPIRTASAMRVATRPIRLDKASVKATVGRLLDAIRGDSNYWPEGAKMGGLFSFQDGVTVRAVSGNDVWVVVQYESKGSRSDSLVLGGGYGRIKGTDQPSVVVFLNGGVPWSAFADDSLMSRGLERDVSKILMHELTHIADVFDKEPTVKTHTGLYTEGDIGDLKKYYNQPSEVRAYMRGVFEDIEGMLLRALGRMSLNEAVRKLIPTSKTWQQINYYLTGPNRKLVLRGVAQAVQDWVAEHEERKSA